MSNIDISIVHSKFWSFTGKCRWYCCFGAVVCLRRKNISYFWEIVKISWLKINFLPHRSHTFRQAFNCVWWREIVSIYLCLIQVMSSYQLILIIQTRHNSLFPIVGGSMRVLDWLTWAKPMMQLWVNAVHRLHSNLYHRWFTLIQINLINSKLLSRGMKSLIYTKY